MESQKRGAITLKRKEKRLALESQNRTGGCRSNLGGTESQPTWE